MTSSIAAYASQYLNRQQHGAASALSSSTSSAEDGSRAIGHSTNADLDDQGDPHLRVSSRRINEDHEGEGGSMRLNSQSIPLIASNHSQCGGGSVSSVGSPKRCLAHLADSPSPMPVLRDGPSGCDSSDFAPPPDLFAPSPLDGLSRPLDVFSPSDPRHVPLSRRKYQDSIWTALWLTGVSICLVSSFLSLFLRNKPKGADELQRRPMILTYTTLLHTISLTTILFVSAAVLYTHIWLLRVFVKPVMIATEVFVLLITTVWALGASRSESVKPEERKTNGKEVVKVVENPEDGWDDKTESLCRVVSYGTKMESERRIAWTAKMVAPKMAANNDWSFDKIFGDGDFIAAGQLIIAPGGKKSRKSTKDNTYIFYVIEGAVKLKIHDTSLILATGGMFMVPQGNTYSIKNISNRDAKLFFTQARKVERRVEATEEQVARTVGESGEEEYSTADGH